MLRGIGPLVAALAFICVGFVASRTCEACIDNRSINKPLLAKILSSDSLAVLGPLEHEVAGRPMQIIYYTKLHSMAPSRRIEKILLSLMPSTKEEFNELYDFSILNRGTCPGLGGEEVYSQISMLPWRYYSKVLPQLVCKYPKHLKAYLVFCYYAEFNAEWAEAMNDGDIRAQLYPCVGEKFDKEWAAIPN